MLTATCLVAQELIAHDSHKTMNFDQQSPSSQHTSQRTLLSDGYKQQTLLQHIRNLFRKKKCLDITLNAYDKAMTCLCFQCPKCLEAVSIQSTAPNEVLPNLHFITKYDSDSGKTLSRV